MAMLHGFGRSFSALDATPVFTQLNASDRQYFANRIVIYNKGRSSNILAVLNCANVADFAALSGNALQVPPDSALELVGDGFPPITAIALSSPSGTNDVVVNAY